MKILGVDPGFAFLGLCRAEFDEDGEVGFWGAQVLKTRRDPKKHAAVDLIDRCRYVASQLPRPSMFDIVAIEGYSYPPTPQAAVKLGAAHGVIAAAIELWDMGPKTPRVVITPPQQARRLVIPGPKSPPEEDVHAKLLADHPSLEKALEGLPKSHRVHALDAAVQIWAALERIRRSDAL